MPWPLCSLYILVFFILFRVARQEDPEEGWLGKETEPYSKATPQGGKSGPQIL